MRSILANFGHWLAWSEHIITTMRHLWMRNVNRLPLSSTFSFPPSPPSPVNMKNSSHTLSTRAFFFSFHWSRIQWNAKGEMELNNTNSDARTLCRELRRKRPIVFIKSIPLNECWRETLLWAEKKTEWKRKRANVPDPRPNECRQSTQKTTKWWTTTFRNRSETMLIKTTCAVHYNKLK